MESAKLAGAGVAIRLCMPVHDGRRRVGEGGCGGTAAAGGRGCLAVILDPELQSAQRFCIPAIYGGVDNW